MVVRILAAEFDEINTLKSDIIILEPNVMKLEFKYNNCEYSIILEKFDRWVGSDRSWKGVVHITNSTIQSPTHTFPLTSAGKQYIMDLNFTKYEQALKLLTKYDYYFEYIDSGSQWKAAKENNERIISKIKSFNFSDDELHSLINRVFPEDETEAMEKLLIV